MCFIDNYDAVFIQLNTATVQEVFTELPLYFTVVRLKLSTNFTNNSIDKLGSKKLFALLAISA